MRFVSHLMIGLLALAGASSACAQSGAPAPTGSIKGSAWQHTANSARGVIAQAALVLPTSVTGGSVYAGPYAQAPAGMTRVKVPVVVFLHGSSGLSLKAIGEWQLWLAGLGVASVAPDSFALPDRVTYTSPIDKPSYERIHALRSAEIGLALVALKDAAWADTSALVLAGASEGGPAVARWPGPEFAAKIVYSWSCENNYFVTEHASVFAPNRPVLNVMSATDVFFSPANAWLGNPAAKGHCGDALKDHKAATIVLIPGAPHTLMNLPAARRATAGLLAETVLAGR